MRFECGCRLARLAGFGFPRRLSPLGLFDIVKRLFEASPTCAFCLRQTKREFSFALLGAVNRIGAREIDVPLRLYLVGIATNSTATDCAPCRANDHFTNEKGKPYEP